MNPVIEILEKYQSYFDNYIQTKTKRKLKKPIGKKKFVHIKIKNNNPSYRGLENRTLRFFENILVNRESNFKISLGSENSRGLIPSPNKIYIAILFYNLKIIKGIYPYVYFNLENKSLDVFIGRSNSVWDERFPDNLFRKFSNAVTDELGGKPDDEGYGNSIKTFNISELRNGNTLEDYIKKLITLFLRTYELNKIDIEDYIKNGIANQNKSKRLIKRKKLLRKFDGEEYDYQNAVNGLPPKKKSRTFQQWQKRIKNGREALRKAKFKCELNKKHETFISKFSLQPFMECHHLIPMHLQDKYYPKSLDIVENIVCICPTCHRELHHGNKRDKLLNKLFTKKREKQILSSGIKINIETLKTFY